MGLVVKGLTYYRSTGYRRQVAPTDAPRAGHASAIAVTVDIMPVAVGPIASYIHPLTFYALLLNVNENVDCQLRQMSAISSG